MNLRKRFIPLLVGLFFGLSIVLPLSAAQVSSQAEKAMAKTATTDLQQRSASQDSPFASDRVIVKFKAGQSKGDIKNLTKKHGLKEVMGLELAHASLMQIQTGKTVEEIIDALNQSQTVEYAEPDFLLEPLATVNDPLYNQEWGLKNTGQSINGVAGTPGIDINVEPAWGVTQGTPEIVVAVIDTGVDISHWDLKDNIWVNTKEVANNGIDDDGNGYIDDVNGWDFFHKDKTVFDAADGDKHGTHVSGTIGASANSIGVIGVAPRVKVMPLKFIGPNGGYTSDAISALNYAKSQGVKVANNSWGGGSFSQALYDAIKNSDLLFVAAAGNSSLNTDTSPMYPAAYDLPNILSVAAVNNTGQLASFSNYGANSVDVAAPGVDIMSTIPKLAEAGAGLEVTGSNYKAIVQGFGLEEFAQAATRHDIMQRALNKLGISTSGPILLVQDDQHNTGWTDVLSYYTSALSGYNYTVLTVPTDANGPDLATMLQYQAVIWFTGSAYGTNQPNLTAADKTNLTQYLNSGYNLYLSGPDILYNSEYSDLVANMLHTVVKYDGEKRKSLLGVANSAYEGAQYTLDGVNQNWNDDLAGNSAEAVVDLVWPGGSDSTSYAYMSGTSMATPHTTGSAALVMSVYPGYTAVQVKQAILSSVKPLPLLTGKVLSGGIVDAANAVGTPSLPDSDDIPGLPLPGSVVNGTLNANSDLDDVFAVHLLKGEKLSAKLTSGTAGTDFDLYLYDAAAATVKSSIGILAFSESPATSNENIAFLAPVEGDYYLDIYAYAGSGSYTLDVQLDCRAGTYENTSPDILYGGSWSTLSDTNASGGSIAAANSPGSSAKILFNGAGVRYQAQKGPNMGIAKLTLDGTTYSIDLYANGLQNKVTVFEKNALQPGVHVLLIEWTDKANRLVRKKSATINIDALTVLGS